MNAQFALGLAVGWFATVMLQQCQQCRASANSRKMLLALPDSETALPVNSVPMRVLDPEIEQHLREWVQTGVRVGVQHVTDQLRGLLQNGGGS